MSERIVARYWLETGADPWRAAETIAARLQEELEMTWQGDRRRSVRLAALDDRFRCQL